MKKSLLILTLLLLSLNLFAIGFGYQILEINTSPNFASYSFPLEIKYQFNFPVPDFYPGNTTLFTFRLFNGLSERTLYQDPKDGRFIDSDESLKAEFKDPNARNYTSQFDEYLLLFEQGLFGRDIIKLHFSFGGRFEKAFERWEWMFNEQSTEGLFWLSPGVSRYNLESWYGTPELSGNRSVSQTMLNCGIALRWFKDDSYTVRNGFNLDCMYRYNPASIQIFEKESPSADFTAVLANFNIAYTPVVLYKRESELTHFSIQLGNDAHYKYVKGSKVPYYMQGDTIYGSYVPSAMHTFTDETYITFFGPQLGAKDLYASLKLFHNAGLSYGEVANTSSPMEIFEYTGSVGFRAEFNIYNICRVFYQAGYLYWAPFNGGDKNIEAAFGFSMEV